MYPLKQHVCWVMMDWSLSQQVTICIPQGLEFGYDIKIREPETAWKFNVGELARWVGVGMCGYVCACAYVLLSKPTAIHIT